jgi:hypothetical protein
VTQYVIVALAEELRHVTAVGKHFAIGHVHQRSTGRKHSSDVDQLPAASMQSRIG